MKQLNIKQKINKFLSSMAELTPQEEKLLENFTEKSDNAIIVASYGTFECKH